MNEQEKWEVGATDESPSEPGMSGPKFLWIWSYSSPQGCLNTISLISRGPC